jgi:hypothetical protein
VPFVPQCRQHFTDLGRAKQVKSTTIANKINDMSCRGVLSAGLAAHLTRQQY